MNLDRVKVQRDRITPLKKMRRHSVEWKTWENQTDRVLAEEFGEKSKEYEQFHKIFHGSFFFPTKGPESEFQRDYEEKMRRAEKMIDSFIEDAEARAPGSSRLACPKCGATEVRFIEFREVGEKELGGKLVISGKMSSTSHKAYYRCSKCGRPLSTTVAET